MMLDSSNFARERRGIIALVMKEPVNNPQEGIKTAMPYDCEDMPIILIAMKGAEDANK